MAKLENLLLLAAVPYIADNVVPEIMGLSHSFSNLYGLEQDYMLPVQVAGAILGLGAIGYQAFAKTHESQYK